VELIVKTALSDLAIFGGTPAFAEPLHVGRPNLGNREVFLRRLKQLLDARWLTNRGPFVQEFEQRVADFLKVKHCVAMCNGTVALEIAIRALGLSGEVIVPAFTFVATAHALKWQEITPVFCDISPKTRTIDPSQVERMITPKTTGVIGVHTWGIPCDIEALDRVARRHKLILLFDAAHAFGCSYQGTLIGGFGNAEVLSFHATKILNTFEGGAVVTNDDELAGKMRLMKNFGFSGYDNVIYIGTNGKMNEVCAAMGLTGLEDLDGFVASNRRNYKQYKAELKGVPGVQLLTYDEAEKCNYQYVVVEIDEAVTHVSRDQCVRVLHAENVLARRYFHPACHRMEPYRSYFPLASLLLPETERLSRRVLCLPTGTAIGVREIGAVCQFIRLIIKHGQEVALRLHSD
jgi:dTDP-4-amino-4,6-dideoxygalactose transaminase